MLAAILISALVIDMELSNVADIIHNYISTRPGVGAFIIISVIYLVGQYLLLSYSKGTTAELRSRRKGIHFIDLIVSGVQLTTIIIFLLVICEIILGGSYDAIILIIVLIISNGLSVLVMLYLFRRLLSYYKSHPDLAILSYLISGFIIATTAVVTIFFMAPAFSVFFPTFVHGTILDTLNYVYYILSIISFLSVWASTVILLRHYSRKLGTAKFWVVVSLPLVFYVSQIFVITLQIPLPIEKLGIHFGIKS